MKFRLRSEIGSGRSSDWTIDHTLLSALWGSRTSSNGPDLDHCWERRPTPGVMCLGANGSSDLRLWHPRTYERASGQALTSPTFY
jgi:hypothetical protein